MSSSITEANSITAYRAGSNAAGTALYRVRAATPNPVYTAVGHSGAVVWSDGGAGGVFTPSGTDNSIASYVPANITQSVVISATDGVNTKTKSLAVTATLPIYPQIGFETELDIDTKVKMARDRTRYFREEGALEIGWTFAWSDREKDQYQELLRFWRDHRKVKQFYLVDTEGDILNKVWFNSSIKSTPSGADRWAISAAFRGLFEDTTASSAEPLHYRINAGGYAEGIYEANKFFTRGASIYLGAVTINSSGVSSPAPDEVYRWTQYDATYVEYLVTGLRALHSYTINLHFCIDTIRTMTPILNGASQTNVVVGAGYVAQKSSYSVTADALGNIRIQLYKVSGTNAILNALEVIE